jgi:hypothetical protein
MPLTPKLNGLIPPQKFEIVRDQIGAIISAEMANQYVLNSTYPKIEKVWVERFIGFNEDTECPAINVSLQKGDFSNKTEKKRDGVYLFNIDVYAMATSTPDEWADQAAMLLTSKIMGMIAAILSAPVYTTLDLPRGYISSTEVVRMWVGNKSTIEDALAGVVGRIQFAVTCMETVELQSSVPLEVSHTRIKLNETEKGFYIETATV